MVCKNYNKVLLSCIFFCASNVYADNSSSDSGYGIKTAHEVLVQSSYSETNDHVRYSAQTMQVQQNKNTMQVGDTLKKLPGVSVLNASGVGSLTTVVQPSATSSGATRFSINDIPVQDVSGDGFNLSLIPSGIVNEIENRSAFFINTFTNKANILSPTGEINLVLDESSAEWSKKHVGVLADSAHTVRGSGTYVKKNLSLGLTALNSKGDFHFKDYKTRSNFKRANNDVFSVGATLNNKWEFTHNQKFEWVAISHHAERTNPGPLDFPTRDHEQDMFYFIGAQYKQKQFFTKLSNTFTRTKISEDLSSQSLAWTLGHSFQMGYSFYGTYWKWTPKVSGELGSLYRNQSAFRSVLERQSFQMINTFERQFGSLRLAPLLQYEWNNPFDNELDYSVSLTEEINEESEIALSYGAFHALPSLTAVLGYQSQSFTLLPNPSLHNERHSLVSATYVSTFNKFKYFLSGFYDHIKNRSLFSTQSYSIGQVEEISAAVLYGGILSLQWTVFQRLAFQGSVSLTKTKDLQNMRELPYKPLVHAFISEQLKLLNSLAVNAEEMVLSSMYSSVSSNNRLPSFFQLNVSVDWRLKSGALMFKIANILDGSGYVTPGFPYQGRNFILGYSL